MKQFLYLPKSGLYVFLILLLCLHTPVQSRAATSADLLGIAITARDNVTGTNREVKLYRQMHAVIIGIDKYQNLTPDQQLSYIVPYWFLSGYLKGK